jgi:serine phosphatase RsbU (regulator of sigma subunit)/anti-sigma regulatory factor (Ser/Thr protein kinase)
MARGPGQLYGSWHKSALLRYAVAVLAALAAVVGQVLLTDEWEVSVYSILVGAVALAVWYGGVGPGIVGVVLAWAGAAVFVVGEHESLDMSRHEAWVQWAVALGVALGMIWVSLVLRRARASAERAADVAEESVAGLENLQRLSSALSAAASVSEVVSTLVEEAPPVVGAPVALGFVEEGDITIAHPEGLQLAEWQVLRLTEGRMLHRTAREGRPLRAVGRRALEAMFPDTAALAPNAQAAIAVPLRVEGRVIGSVGFVFDHAEEAHDEAEALAIVVAGLGGQALERARLYERELESRRGLDRILRVAPRFFAGSESVVTDAICREARTVFGADIAMLWRVEGERLELSAFDPQIEPLHTGLGSELDDFPRLRDAVHALNVSFVPDVSEEALGEGLVRVRRLGIRSSLRVPVVIAGEAELVLIVSWQTMISPPDSSTLVLVRRFADQAGLALEQVERRKAEAEAARRAIEARRLHEMTAALAHAATPAEVGAVCLEHTRLAVGAKGGFVVRAPVEGEVLHVVATDGDVGGRDLDAITLDSDALVARAIRSGEPVWQVDAGGSGSAVVEDRGACVALPLESGPRVLAAVELVFDEGFYPTADVRDRLDAIVAQCALALERSFLLDSELRLRRLSERLQSITAELSNALTRADVARVLLDHVDEAVGTECAVLALLGDGLRLTELLGWHGFDDDVAERWLDSSFDAETPQGQAIRRLAPFLYDAAEGVEDTEHLYDPARTGHRSFLFVPLVLGRRPLALLVASSHSPLDLGPDDLRFVAALAGQAAQALDRARRFESEQRIAETLQQSVLPASLPASPGIQLAGRYLPGTAELEVGGDWYDAIPLPNGRFGLVVGDVVGKGVRAAATMGQLRNAIRAFSLERLKPTTTLGRLNRLAEDVIETSFATVVYAELDPESGVCRYACAGHPPPLFATLDGRVEYLDGGRGLPLGTGTSASYRQAVVELPHGSVLLFYTDGLIERRGRSLDEGLERLRAAVSTGPRDPERLAEHVLEHLFGDEDRRDDVVLLVARLLPVAPRPLDLRLDGGHASLRNAREALRLWLASAPVGEMDTHDIVLAAWEASANATEHSLSESGFRLFAQLVDDTVRIVVEDAGTWAAPAARPDRGRGLQLMRALMSSVEVEPGPRGTRVTLEKRLLVEEPEAPVTAGR